MSYRTSVKSYSYVGSMITEAFRVIRQGRLMCCASIVLINPLNLIRRESPKPESTRRRTTEMDGRKSFHW